ncbi:MAG TPA: hypothetical protein PKZ32_06320 [Candidatus Melainabacteria bacterium]|nr:hypothetical protein [Candidatus Melainabacteria bacterium]
MFLFFSINTLMFLLLLWLRGSLPVSTQIGAAVAFGALMCGFAAVSVSSEFREILRFRSSDPVGNAFKYALAFVFVASSVGWIVLYLTGLTVALGWLLLFSFVLSIVNSLAGR